MDRSARVEVRVTPDEKVAWAKHAGGARNVSEWLRGLANDAVSGVAKPADAKILRPLSAPKKPTGKAKRERTEMCMHRVPVTAYCHRCDG